MEGPNITQMWMDPSLTWRKSKYLLLWSYPIIWSFVIESRAYIKSKILQAEYDKIYAAKSFVKEVHAWSLISTLCLVMPWKPKQLTKLAQET